MKAGVAWIKSSFVLRRNKSRWGACGALVGFIALIAGNSVFAGPPVFQQSGNLLVMSNANVRVEFTLTNGRADFFWRNGRKIAGFYSGVTLTSNYILSDADFRRLILAKAAGNISDGSIQSINAILIGLFPSRGTVYIADNLNMTATITMTFVPTAIDIAILELPNVLPIPAGVVVNISHP